MKKLSLSLLFCMAFFAIASLNSFGQSAKNAATTAPNILVPATSGTGGAGGWVSVLDTGLHTSQQKDLIMGVSLETGLFTRTLVKSKGGTQDTSTAEANVQVRVLIDAGTAAQRIAEPGVVTFDKRFQSLMAKLGGVLNCTDVNGDGVITFDECTLTDEEIELILSTLAAHAFNFVLDDLGSGDHTVTVQVRVTTNTSTQNGEAAATGAVGKGSVTVEEVRLVKGSDITIN
jgi:hypothetical protein